MTDESYQLHRLSNLKDYQVSKEDPDVRGWYVVGSDRYRLGRISDLILTPELRRVRYLEIKLEADILANKNSHRILVPIGKARIDQDDDIVIVDSLDINKVRFYPVYSGDPITRDYESSLREALHEKQTQHAYAESSTVVTDDEPLLKMQKERDIARSERDILRSEVEMLKAQLKKARAVLEDDFYEHESFDDRQFYENRHVHHEPTGNL